MQGNIVAKPNYHQARKQRELTRKARQQEKQQRKNARTRVAGASPQVETLEDAGSTPGTALQSGDESLAPTESRLLRGD